jgi:hypothetical protein
MAGFSGRRESVRRGAGLNTEALEERVVPTLLGQQLFPADYPWNQNIANAPVAGNSAAIINHIGTGVTIHADWGEDNPANGAAPLYGIPFNVVHGNTTPKVHVVIDNYPGESDLLDVPIPPNAVIEGDYQNGPNLNGPADWLPGGRGDSHLLVWDVDNNVAYELYLAARPNDAVGPGGDPTGGVWHAGGEAVWDMKADSFRHLGWTSADAAGLSILAGLVRPDEGLPVSEGGQGVITHALRFTLPNSVIDGFYTYPGSHVANSNNSSSNLPYGGRLRLKSNTAVNNLIATMGPEAQIVARAMQQYGLVLADGGSAMYVNGASAAVNANNQISLVWNMDDALGIQALTAGMFDVVDLTPRVTGLSASGGSPGTAITITGQNFSGAAGHLSVFFGTTPAGSVTYVDDSHIAAVVPAGAGTVHVTVQSGVNSPDPDNIKTPIFGYGTSATSAADQFTISTGPPVSGTNSTVSFATAAVSSGSGDAVTIAVQDTGGSPVTGLSGGAFTLSLSGGTSAGTFGAVAATATPGTYTATFTGTTAGAASSLTVVVNGVTLASHPTVQVTPGPVSGTSSTVSFATATVASGSTDTVTIRVKDAAGNAITGLANGAFGFSLTGGTSTGIFGSMTETATPGTYTATFTAAAAAGTPSSLTVTASEVTLTAHPTVQVVPGPVSGSNSTASFANASVASGGGDPLTVVVRDAAGNAITGLTTAAFGLSLSGGASAGTFGAVTATGTPGTYTVTFTGTTAGTASSLSVTVSGVTLASHPAVQVVPGPVSGATSTAGFATSTVASGNTDVVTIAVKDAAGNAITGLAGTAFALGLSGGASGGTWGSAAETATPGTYTATLTAVTAGTASALTATVGGTTLTAHPTVQVTPGPVSGSNSTAGFAAPTVFAGGTDVVTIVVKDAAGNAISGLANAAFALGLAGGTSDGTFGAVTAAATPGTYTAAFTGTAVGTASTLTVTVNGVTLASQPTVTVNPNPISASTSTAGFAAGTVASGSPDVVTIAVKDSVGGPVGGLPGSNFVLTLAGGGSAGTFGTVTETATAGTYTATFTGTTAGTASSLTVVVSGVTLTANPTVQVVPGPVSGTTSTVGFTAPTVTAGNTDLVTVVVKDAAGNPVGGLAGGAFGLSLSGGTSTGSFGAVTATGTPGTYTATFTGAAAGTPASLAATVGGVVLAAHPTVRVTAGAVSLSQSTFSATPTTAAFGQTVTITLTARDAQGNREPGGGLAVAFGLAPGSAGGGFAGVIDHGNGTYTVTFAATAAGTDQFTALIGGRPVTSTPPVVAVMNPPPVVPPPPPPAAAPRLVVAGAADGSALVYPAPGGQVAGTPAATLRPFGAVPTNVRTATADVDGDGTPDTILVTGPGTPARFAVVSGKDDTTVLVPPTDPLGGDFTGGLFVAAGDLDGDGRAEIVITPDQGGGPNVVIYSLGAGGSLTTPKAFFALGNPAFRGGARSAMGDINHDGTPDLVVGAGFLGGPNVEIHDGRAVAAGDYATLIGGGFFAFDGPDAVTLRNGVFLAVGDVNGDGFADLIVGGGPGGAPRVLILDGHKLATNDLAGAEAAPVANFFVAGDDADRGGVRLAARDLDGDGRAEVVAGSGEGSASRVRVYSGMSIGSGGEPAAFQDIDPFGGPLPGGVFVG